MANKIKLDLFYTKLNEKISDYNARLLMQNIMVSSGLNHLKVEDDMDAEDVKTICLELIKRGGPAYKVGSNIYGLTQ